MSVTGEYLYHRNRAIQSNYLSFGIPAHNVFSAVIVMKQILLWGLMIFKKHSADREGWSQAPLMRQTVRDAAGMFIVVICEHISKAVSDSSGRSFLIFINQAIVGACQSIAFVTTTAAHFVIL